MVEYISALSVSLTELAGRLAGETGAGVLHGLGVVEMLVDRPDRSPDITFDRNDFGFGARHYDVWVESDRSVLYAATERPRIETVYRMFVVPMREFENDELSGFVRLGDLDRYYGVHWIGIEVLHSLSEYNCSQAVREMLK